MSLGTLIDLDSPERIAWFIDRFYGRVLKDARLRPIFLDAAGIDLPHHLPLIQAYWCKLLLGQAGYQRHTMNIHRALHQHAPLAAEDFSRWLGLFIATLRQDYHGPCSEKAAQIASSIASNMQKALLGIDAPVIPDLAA